MSNTIDNHPGEQNQVNTLPTRVSYTINNQQPVISTIIGSDPLFYMDYNDEVFDEFDEEYFVDESDLSFLEGELASLNKQMQLLDGFSAEYTHTNEKAAEIFLEAKASILGTESNKTADLETLISALSKSRLAKAYLDHAEEFGVEIILTGQVSDASYDRKAQKILINENINLTDQILLASRELRRHWQHRAGALLNPMHFHPDSAIVINRAQTADLITSVIRIAWELQLSGDKTAWERIENSSFADLGRAFIREAYLDFRTINSGQASTAVFEAWFLSDRCRAEDRNLIRQMLADHEGYVFDINSVHTSVTPNLIAALGEMPFGKNYLSAHVDTILNDSIFTEVRDRSNANFLWFIKFERTFRETEHELQSSNSSQAGQSASATSNTMDNNNEEKIVTLYDAPKSAPGKQTSKETGKASDERILKSPERKGSHSDEDNIIYLRTAPAGESA